MRSAELCKNAISKTLKHYDLPALRFKINFPMDISVNRILNYIPSPCCVPVETTGIRVC